ncbi:hypothetical protein BGZ47_000038 [Haplosporangium gracile]|nr:hypothetical protein BGZ47_000038 [Haplosporangium gracile]
MSVNAHASANVASNPYSPHNSIGGSSKSAELPAQTVHSIQHSAEFLRTSSQIARGSWSSLQPRNSEEESQERELQKTVPQEMSWVESWEELQEKKDESEQETKTRKKNHSKKLEKLVNIDGSKLKPNAKELIKLMVEFMPEKRLELKNFRRQNFFNFGYFLKVMSEDGFKGAPELPTDGKRKAVPSESEQETDTKTKLDHYWNLAIFYCNTDSYETEF